MRHSSSRNWLRVFFLLVPTLTAGLVAAAPNVLSPGEGAGGSASDASPSLSYSVGRSGTAGYHYPFDLPEGRGAYEPKLGLSYSSAGTPLGSEIAWGWSLAPVPTIRREVRREATSTDRVYVAIIGDGEQDLLPVLDYTAFGGQAYRARIDDNFVRFEYVPAIDAPYWYAMTPTGVSYRFDLQGPNEWKVTSVKDRWGNETDFTYQPVWWNGQQVDSALTEIDYTLNRSSPQVNYHARVVLTYTAGQVCTGSDALNANNPKLPIGALVDYRTGARRIHGTQHLSQVDTLAYDFGASTWRNVRRYNLNYNTNAGNYCADYESPRYFLNRVDVTGFSGSSSLSGPSSTFTYGSAQNNGNLQGRNIPLPTDSVLVQGSAWDNLGNGTDLQGCDALHNIYLNYRFMDMDGDSLPDLVETGHLNNACAVTWYKNLGLNQGFGPPQTFPLPAPASTGATRCSLLGYDVEVNGRICAYPGNLTTIVGIEDHIDYRWVDIDGDGDVDLLAGGNLNFPTNVGLPPAPQCLSPACALAANPNQCTTRVACKDAYSQDASYIAPDLLPVYDLDHCFSDPGYPYPFSGVPNPPLPCGNGYVWAIYKNNGGVFSTTPQFLCEPVALGTNYDAGPNAPWSGRPPAPLGNLFDLVDMNGDGIPDIVAIGFVDAREKQPGYPTFCPNPNYADRRQVFNIFFGNGDGTFSNPPEMWMSPSWPTDCDDATATYNALIDMNGDGLPDLVHNSSNPQGVHVAFNRGHGFDTNYVTLMTGNPGAFPSRDSTTLCTYFVNRRSAFVDKDGDHIPDFATGYNYYGSSLGFSNNSTFSTRTGSNFSPFFSVDWNGDGFLDQVNPQAYNGTLPVTQWVPSDDGGSGLLIQVDNGRGGQVKFHYTPGNNTSVVKLNQTRPGYAASWGSSWVPPTRAPHHWVVKQTDVLDGNGNTASTTYTYEDPVFANADDRISAQAQAPYRAFHGFQAVTKQLPAIAGETQGAVVFERYDYTLDRDGRLDYRTVKGMQNGSLVKQTVDQTSWTAETVLSAANKFVHPTSRTHIDCQPSTNDSACDAQTTFKTVTSSQYANPLGSGAIYQQVSTTAQSFSPSYTTSRTNFTDFLLLYNGADYLSLPKRHGSWGTEQPPCPPGQLCAGFFPGYSQLEELFFDGGTSVDTCGSSFGNCKGALTKRRVYRTPTASRVTAASCTDESICVDYGYWYEPRTGVPLREVSPKDMRAATGNPAVAASTVGYAYDPSLRFHTQVTTTAGQSITQTFDAGTSKMLSQTGPNWMWVWPAVCFGPCSPSPSYEQRTYAYDALGRLLTETQPKYGLLGGYTSEVSHMLSYTGFTQVSEYFALDWTPLLGGTKPWTKTVTTSDGLGRVRLRQEWLNGASTSTSGGEPSPSTPYPVRIAAHSYGYDARGGLVTVTSPDPANDSAVVTRTIQRDALGRTLLETTRNAAGTTLASRSATYSAWDRWRYDADNKVVHQTLDGFGHIRFVQEGGPDVAANSSYFYDAQGHLTAFVDPDGHQTNIGYDGEGHRTYVSRLGGRNWTWAYDPDGNVKFTRDPDGRTNTQQSDGLGRLTDEWPDAKLNSDPNVALSMANDLGIGHAHYTYEPYSGRMSRIDLYRPSTTGDQLYTSVVNSYDGAGQLQQQQWTLNMPEIGGQRTFTNTVYNGPYGNPTSVTYPNGQQATWSWLGGRPYQISAGGQTLATYSYNLSGRPTLMQGLGVNYPAHNHSYAYDSLGRVRNETISVGGAIAQSLNRTYDYFPDGDVWHEWVDDRLNDGWLQYTLTFGRDSLHRVTSAQMGPLAGGNPTIFANYGASLAYTLGGNVNTGTVTGALDMPPRSGVTWQYGGGGSATAAPVTGPQADVQAVTALVQANGSHLADYWYDLSGNLVNRNVWGWPNLYSSFIYDANDQVRKVTNGQGQWEKYFYVGRQRFLAVSSSSTWRFYMGKEVEVDHQSSTTETSSATIAGVARLKTTNCSSNCTNVEVTMVDRDRRGDVISVFDESSAMRAHFAYGAFGETIYKYDNTYDWRRQFGDQEHDNVDVLNYFGNRYYDPLTLRWTSMDPLVRAQPDIAIGRAQRLNLFAFSNNNPLRYVDPNGLWPPDNDEDDEWEYDIAYVSGQLADEGYLPPPGAPEWGSNGDDFLVAFNTTAGARAAEAAARTAATERIAAGAAEGAAEGAASTSPAGLAALALLMKSDSADQTWRRPPMPEWHHIATVENTISIRNGGAWTPRFDDLFRDLGFSGIRDPRIDQRGVNIVQVWGHHGPHPYLYHQIIYDTLTKVKDKCGEDYDACRAMTINALQVLGKEIQELGTPLNLLVTIGNPIVGALWATGEFDYLLPTDD